MSERLDKMLALMNEVAVCEKCSLHLSRKKSVPGEGNISTKILFIGEGPGMNENETGRPFVGMAGNFLNELLDTAGVRRKDVFITNVVKCRPPQNRDPLPEELSACALFLDRQIEIIDPLVIVTLGRFSMARYFPLQRISSIHGEGKWIDGRMVVPMFHPAAALHQPKLRESIIEDFKKLPSYLHEAAQQVETIDVADEQPQIDSPDDVTPMADDGQLSLF